jgi:uncharacterized membrane protein YgaE (UPF0421/DUF939 family)
VSSRGVRTSSQDPSFGGKIASWVTLVLPPLQSSRKKASEQSISASSFQTLKSFFKTEISRPWEETSIPREQQQRQKAKHHRGPDDEEHHQGQQTSSWSKC